MLVQTVVWPPCFKSFAGCASPSSSAHLVAQVKFMNFWTNKRKTSTGEHDVYKTPGIILYLHASEFLWATEGFFILARHQDGSGRLIVSTFSCPRPGPVNHPISPASTSSNRRPAQDTHHQSPPCVSRDGEEGGDVIERTRPTRWQEGEWVGGGLRLSVSCRRLRWMTGRTSINNILLWGKGFLVIRFPNDILKNSICSMIGQLVCGSSTL